MNNNDYKVGEQIRYSTTQVNGKYVPDRLAHTCLGYIVKTYYDGAVMVVDENGRYYMVEAEQIMERAYDPSPLAVLMIDLMEKVMPLEYWALASLALGIVIGIGGKIL